MIRKLRKLPVCATRADRLFNLFRWLAASANIHRPFGAEGRFRDLLTVPVRSFPYIQLKTALIVCRLTCRDALRGKVAGFGRNRRRVFQILPLSEKGDFAGD